MNSDLPEPCAEHTIPLDDPFAIYRESAQNLYTSAQVLAAIDERDQLDAVRDLAARQLIDAQAQIRVMLWCLREVGQ